MAGPTLFDTGLQTLQKAIELRQLRQQVIAGNVANADTPGYHPRRVDFEKELQQAVRQSAGVRKTRARHLGPGGGPDKVTPEVHLEPDAVNVDQEMTRLAENQILYEAAVQALNKKLGLLKYVAQGGR
ncbi:MAG: flagellar basal body rod protein FlgB [Deltaproteobacteria bacterium]|nr:MAG: flagellar basal body rod protein FlgB [Deltaproteobacteria bacterium]